MLKTYVISLKTAHNRQAHIKNEFGRQDIYFEFFDAITPNLIETTCQKLNIDLMNAQNLSPTEKACFLSHLMVMQQGLKNHLPYIAIFEDDIYLGEQAKPFLDDITYLTNNNINLLKLETFLQYKKIDKLNAIHLYNNRQAHILKEYHLGMAGYIISHSTITLFFDYLKTLTSNQLLPIDRLLFDKFMAVIDIHQLNPALCIQEHIRFPNNIQLPSSLEQERKLQQQHKPKRTLLQKIRGEFGNVFKKTIGKSLRELIGFR